MIALLIVGAGPAGMSAAVEAQKHGVHPTVIDNRPEPGGNIYAYLGSTHRSRPTRMPLFGSDYAKGLGLLSAFNDGVASRNITYLPSTKLWQIDADGEYAFDGPQGSQSGRAKQVLLATGAQERPMPIPGWTLPGVMGVGGAQILMKSGAELPEGDIVIVGAGPLPLLVTDQLCKAGRTVKAIVEPKGAVHPMAGGKQILRAAMAPRTSLKGLGLLTKRAFGKTPVWRGATDLTITGKDRATGLSFRAKQSVDLDASIILLHDGIVPNLNPLRAASLTTRYSRLQHTWHAQSESAVQVIGDGARIMGVEAAVISGRVAAAKACGTSPNASDTRKLAKLWSFRTFLDSMYPPVRLARNAPKEAVLCRCERVTADAVNEAVKIHGANPNALKRALRIGMGPCQGRMCAHSLADFTAELTQSTPEQVGLQNPRSPILPVSLGALADLTLPTDG
ncbi:MAG: FAD-dependent oxidoreductase [Sedimentitalea sp.]